MDQIGYSGSMRTFRRGCLAVGVLGVGGVLVQQGLAIRNLRRQNTETQEAIGRLEMQGEDLNRRLAALQMAALDRPALPSMAREGDVPRLRVPPQADSAGALGLVASTVLTDEIQKLVEKKVDDKLKAAQSQKTATGDRKVALADLAKELGLDPGSEERMSEIANGAKQQILEVAKQRRPDGTSLADDLIDSFMKGDEKNTRAVFARLFTDKVPRSDLTYAAAVGRIQDKANQGFQGQLAPDIYRRFRHMDIKPENIETGFDPWAEYARTRSTK